MMKILYVSDASSPHTSRLVESFRDQGAEVHVASFRPETIEGAVVHLLPTFGLGRLGYLLALPALRRLTKQLAPDIVHAQYVTSYGFLSAIAGLRPLVLTAWGSDVLISPRQSKILHWFASYAIRHADVVVTVAQHMNSAVVSLGAPVDNICVVPFGVDSQKFVPPASRPAVPPLRLICTRNLAPIYSISTLLTALQEVAARGLSLNVDLVADGPLKAELQAQAEKAGMSSWVRFHGRVDHVRLAELLAQAHVFVTPALSDGNNVSLTEAMSCACFPIATDIPANSQWISHGVNGFLYPSGDASRLAECILRAASDVDLRARAGIINRDIVEKRADWRVSVAHMRDVYNKAINRAGGLV